MEPKRTSQLGSKNLKTALVPSEIKSKPGEGCERVVEAMAMNAASKEKEKRDSILESEKRVEYGMKGHCKKQIYLSDCFLAAKHATNKADTHSR